MSVISASTPSRTSVWQEREWWLAIGGSVLILAVNLLRPLHYDNALFQSIGWQWVRYGRKLYVGTFDQNFPGVLYFHAISCILFGTSEIGFRALETSLHLLEAMGIYCLVRRSHKPLTALTAALLSCLIYLSGSDWSVGQRDAFAMVALVFATILYFQLKDRQFSTTMQLCIALVIGLLMGLVILLRPTYVLFAFWQGVVMLLTLKESRWIIATGYTAGAAVALMAAFWPYFAIPGVMDFIYTAIVKFNIDVYGTSKYRRTPWQADAWKHWSFVITAVAFFIWVGARNRASLRRKGWIVSNTERRIFCRCVHLDRVDGQVFSNAFRATLSILSHSPCCEHREIFLEQRQVSHDHEHRFAFR
jgi:4-amino-4-deoxy-L-arabinose transferase-like glycosyltransferase